jgi:hypothetical protein
MPMPMPVAAQPLAPPRPEAAAPTPAPPQAASKRLGKRLRKALEKTLKSVWTWVGAVAASVAASVIFAMLPSTSSAAPANASAGASAAAPIAAVIDTTGASPCGMPQSVVAAPGPVGKPSSNSYAGQPASGGWLNVLIQGDGSVPVTIESVTAKVVSRQPEQPGAVLYSYCQSSAVTPTYLRLDLRSSQSTVTSVPAPAPSKSGPDLPLPLQVTGDSPAQLYVQPISGDTTIRWSLQIHWEQGSRVGVLTALVTDGSSAPGPDSTVMTTVGTAGDTELCPESTGQSSAWTVIEDGEC